MWEDPEPVERQDYEEHVLVAVVPRLQDWQRVLEEGWYRIPLARAPRRIGADYLAFYHPKVFSALRWTVTYYAPIRRYTLVPRQELLPEEPDHPRAQELYYKIEIGPLEALPRPIVSNSLRRVTFIMTTFSRLLQAEEINDLWVRERAQDRLHRAWRLGEFIGPLRRISSVGGQYPTARSGLVSL